MAGHDHSPKAKRDSRCVTVASSLMRFLDGGSAGTRTRNQRLKRALLYRLSYRPTQKKFFNPAAASLQQWRMASVPTRLGRDGARLSKIDSCSFAFIRG